MKQSKNKMTDKNTKAEILQEYQRLRHILKHIRAMSAKIDENGIVSVPKSILKPLKSSNEVEPPTSLPALSNNDNCVSKDVLGRVKNYTRKSTRINTNSNDKSSGRPFAFNDKSNGQQSVIASKPVIRLFTDPNISNGNGMRKVKQGRVGKEPLRRSTRRRPQVDYSAESVPIGPYDRAIVIRI